MIDSTIIWSKKIRELESKLESMTKSRDHARSMAESMTANTAKWSKEASEANEKIKKIRGLEKIDYSNNGPCLSFNEVMAIIEGKTE